MNALKVFSLIEKVRKSGLEIKFLPKEEAINQNGICIYTEKGIPKGIYIPFSEVSKLSNIVKELVEKDSKLD